MLECDLLHAYSAIHGKTSNEHSNVIGIKIKNTRNIMRSVINKRKKLLVKTLAFATVLCSMMLGFGGKANAVDLSDIDFSQKPLGVSTLDYLNEQGVEIKQVGKPNIPIPRSWFQLNEIDTSSDDNDVITRYIIDDAGQLEAHDFQVQMTQTLYGEADGTHNIYFEWDKETNDFNEDTPVALNNYHWRLTPVDGADSSYDLIFRYNENDGRQDFWTSGDVETVIADVIGVHQNGQGGGMDMRDCTITNAYINFVNNTSPSQGGGINVDTGAYIVNFVGNFINNSITYTPSVNNGGGAIRLSGGHIGNLSGNFIANRNEDSWGGAINNGGKNGSSGTIDYLSGIFWANSAKKGGGAIHNAANCTIREINADFIANYSDTQGGAVDNQGEIGDITGDFIANRANERSGAIKNSEQGTIHNITGDFVSNVARTSGAAIHNDATITNINANFVNNTVTSAGSTGAAIDNHGGTIASVVGKFVKNTAQGNGGAVYNNIYDEHAGGTTGRIKSLKGEFIQNSAGGDGGAVYNNADCNIDKISGNFVENTSNSVAGAIYNLGTMGEIYNSSFVNNSAKDTAGAIYTEEDLDFTADGYKSVISGNKISSGDAQAFYLANGSTLNFNLKNNAQIVLDDKIAGDNDYNVNILGDNLNSNTFYLFNNITDANVTMGGVTINTVNNKVNTYNFNSLTLTEDINMIADVDVAKGEMDRFKALSYGNHGANKLNLIGLNTTSEMAKTQNSVKILFAENGLKDSVQYNINSATGHQTIYTPIFKYNVKYDKTEDKGYLVIERPVLPENGGASGGGFVNTAANFNPAILASPVAAQVGTYAAQNAAFGYAFQHADSFMMDSAASRFAKLNRNKFAINSYEQLPYNSMRDNSIWVRPYVTFENVGLDNGPKVNVINYGTLIGGDSDIKELKHGWSSVFSAYAGYNGSNMSYNGVDISQNGGLLGATQTWYKKNFFTALTATAGATVADASTMYGHENFTNLMAGIASKTGYNLEFKEGRYIIQPSMRLAYSFINTFDYTNAAGIRIDSDPLHAIQINPNIRFISNLKNGWRPYASVGMVWNILDDTKVSANNIVLPQMSIKPYVEYGVGIQKQWKDRFTGWGQAMVRNGGRNGIALTLGFRWSLGKESTKIQRVKSPNYSNRTVLKQPRQKTSSI